MSAAALAGCTTAELASVKPELNFPPDPELPAEVAEVPTLTGRPAVAAAEPAAAEENAAVAAAEPAPAGESTQVAAAEPQAAAAPSVAAQSFAGPTPTSAAASPASEALAASRPVAARSPELDALIARYAGIHGIPETLLRRVVNRESTFNPAARNGPYWGLMQIRHDTAQGMGYRGPASGLLDAETNLKYAGKYLRGAYITAGGDHDQAVRFYARGYYYDAKRKGLLEETGLRPGRRRAPENMIANTAPSTLPAVAPAVPSAPRALATAAPEAGQPASTLGFNE